MIQNNGVKYYRNKKYGYTAMAEESNTNKEIIHLKICGFDNCMKSRKTPEDLEIKNNIPIITISYNKQILDISFIEISKQEYEFSLTDNLRHTDKYYSYTEYSYAEAYIFRNIGANIGTEDFIIYKTRLVLSDLGIYDIERHYYPESESIAFTQEEIKNMYRSKLETKLNEVKEQIRLLQGKQTKILDRLNKVDETINQVVESDKEIELDSIELD